MFNPIKGGLWKLRQRVLLGTFFTFFPCNRSFFLVITFHSFARIVFLWNGICSCKFSPDQYISCLPLLYNDPHTLKHEIYRCNIFEIITPPTPPLCSCVTIRILNHESARKFKVGGATSVRFSLFFSWLEWKMETPNIIRALKNQHRQLEPWNLVTRFLGWL